MSSYMHHILALDDEATRLLTEQAKVICDGHSWVDITEFGEPARNYMCTQCGTERTEARDE